MTPDQRRARAERFRLWWEQDGMGAAVGELAAAYIARMAGLDATDKDFADKAKVLSIAAKVVKQVEAQVKAVVADGTLAADEIARLERMKELRPSAKRWL